MAGKHRMVAYLLLSEITKQLLHTFASKNAAMLLGKGSWPCNTVCLFLSLATKVTTEKCLILCLPQNKEMFISLEKRPWCQFNTVTSTLSLGMSKWTCTGIRTVAVNAITGYVENWCYSYLKGSEENFFLNNLKSA